MGLGGFEFEKVKLVVGDGERGICGGRGRGGICEGGC